ncbi:type VI secretion system protein ImpG [Alkalispirillum mobile]|uniref:Type VI secretion system protein ImpG n=2 Tax=Alkalispirillum mobile TaxID=85925 RepID=A0A498C7H9_9GAMM|nr:type VI secretion system protein ImpG [Alkalispirillum mobile]
MLNRYFRDELNYLRQEGREFAQAYPQLSQFLSERGDDPDVERLLEGFAFLTGRMREKVEDEFPELTHSLIALLWPHYLRPVPSMAIVRFDPRWHALRSGHRLARGTLLTSAPVQGVPCRFRTSRDVTLYPLAVAGVDTARTRRRSRVTLSLRVHSDQPLAELQPDPLRLFLGGDGYTARTLYLWLQHYLEGIDLVVSGHRSFLPADSITAVGFQRDEAVLPYPRNSFQGYRILQEYLCLPDAFRFLDLRGLSDALPHWPAERFELTFRFARTLPVEARVQAEHFQLHCAPAVNLFEQDADPIDLTGERAEYRIVPGGRNPDHCEIYSVDSVAGWVTTGNGRFRGKPRRYAPFESFQHQLERDRGGEGCYYRVRLRESLRNDGFDHDIAFVRDNEVQRPGDQETVSLRLTCTNRRLPEALAVGDISDFADDTPALVEVHNVTRPTPTLRPQLGGELLWTLISNLALNYLSLLHTDALRSVLRAYDFRALVDRQAERASQQRLAGIRGIETSAIDRLHRGVPVRGMRSVVTLDEAALGDEGGLYQFGCVLARFFALYASINAFHELQVVNLKNQERYTWKWQPGQQPLM